MRRLLGAFGASYRFVVVRGAVLFVLAWVAAAVAIPILIPPTSGKTEGLGDLLPRNSPAVAAQQQSFKTFSVPVVAGTTIVIHRDGSLDTATQQDIVAFAVDTTKKAQDHQLTGPFSPLAGAIPVPLQKPDTTVTYLYVQDGTSLAKNQKAAEAYAAHFTQPGVRTYITGLDPAQVAQSNYLNARIDIFGIVSVLLVGLVVAVTFRSLAASLAVLLVAGAGYVITRPLLGLLAQRLGFPLPDELEPLIVALLLGVVTDYNVLFLSRFRAELAADPDKKAATRATLKHEALIVTVAALTVAGGLLALLSANLQLFRTFGPALSLTVLFGLAVSVTLTPALMSLLGRRLFHPISGRSVRARADAAVRPSPVMRAALWVVTVRWRAAALFLALVVGLLVAAFPALRMRFDLSFTAGLPVTDQARQGVEVLARDGIAGLTAPIEVIVQGPGVGGQKQAFAAFEQAVAREPGIVRVIGPADNPLQDNYGVVVSKDGNAARLVAILNSDPLGADAIDQYRRLQRDLPALATQAGLSNATVTSTGQTAIASELSRLTRHNMEVTLLVALAVQLVILLLYLRSVIAPIALLLCSALGVAATLGLTVLFFQHLRHDQGLQFYVPFATAVLLLSLGADYNVFSVGNIWDEARRRPLAEALRVAVPRSSRAVTAAGVILATTFATVSIIPLESFREIAFTMAVGLVIDTVIVRPLLTPAILTLLGRAASWPTRRIRTRRSRRDLDVPAPPYEPAPL